MALRDLPRKLAQLAMAAATIVVTACILLVAAATVPTFFGYQSYIVRSGSMEPAVHVGSSVVGQFVSPSELREGDVITFFAGNLVVTHRLSRIERGEGGMKLRTQGDANSDEDLGQVDLTKPVARVLYSVPLAGYLIVYLSEPGTRLFLIGLGAFLLWMRSRRGSQSSGLSAGAHTPEAR